jgi:hypothetical protein
MPITVATPEPEIRRIVVRSQPGQIVLQDPIAKKQKKASQKRASEVAQGVGPEFKPPYHQKKKKKF